MRESGFDTSDRFGPFSGATHHYAPVCLNSLLYRYERDMAHFAHLLGQAAGRAALGSPRQRPRRGHAALSLAAKGGRLCRLRFCARQVRRTTHSSLRSIRCGPEWPRAKRRTRWKRKLNLFERPGGLSTSNTNTGLQWDEPYGWAPTNWIAVAGLDAMGFHADAARIAQHFDATVDAGFAADGTIREKYNVVAGNAQVTVSTGYTQNVIGFGWTNAVYLKMKEIADRATTVTANQ